MSNRKHQSDSLNNPIKYENLIVGGGIAGMFLAYHLNSSTLLVDSDHVGSGATPLSAGTLYSPFKSIQDLKLGPDEVADWGTFKDYLAAGSVALFKALPPRFHDAMSAIPGMMVGRAETKQYLSETYKNGLRMGQSIELLGRDQLVRKEPILSNSKIMWALFAPHSYQVNPGLILHELASFLMNRESNKLEIKENTSVKQITKTSNKYEVKLSDNSSISCNRIFLTNGVGVNEVSTLINVYVPIYPVKGTMLKLEMKEKPNNMIFSAHSFYNWYTHGLKVPYYSSDLKREEIDHYYGKSTKDGVYFGFGRYVQDKVNYDIDEERMNRFVKSLKELFGEFEPSGAHWAGIMPFSMYGRPIVGDLGAFGHENMYVVNGFGPIGITLAPMATKLLVDIIQGEGSQYNRQIMEYLANSCSAVQNGCVKIDCE